MPRLFSGKVILYLLVLQGIDLCIAPAFGGFRPIFLYLWVLYVAFNWPIPLLIPAAVSVGILRDLGGSLPLGVETVSLGAMSGLLAFCMLKFQSGLALMRLILTVFFVFFTSILCLTLSSLLASNMTVTWHAFSSSLSAALASAVFMPLFFHVTRKGFPPVTSSLKQYELFG